MRRGITGHIMHSGEHPFDGHEDLIFFGNNDLGEWDQECFPEFDFYCFG